jgi:lipoprotein-releasing system ATP-binding protein
VRAGPPLLVARGLRRVLPGEVPVTLIDGVDLDIRAGEFLAITGPSGSGKSSLLYLLGLLDEPTGGELSVEGRQTAKLSEDARAALRLSTLGFVFQFHFLLPEFSALDNVRLPMRALAKLSETEQIARARELLVSLGLEDHLHKRPEQMSGGQRQRVAIARALANAPKLVFADEPTGNLDSHATEQVLAILRGLVDEGRASVAIVTHDLALARQADRRLHVVDGRLADADPFAAPRA